MIHFECIVRCLSPKFEIARKEHPDNCDDNVITQVLHTLAIHSSRYEAHAVGKVGETSRS